MGNDSDRRAADDPSVRPTDYSSERCVAAAAEASGLPLTPARVESMTSIAPLFQRARCVGAGAALPPWRGEVLQGPKQTLDQPASRPSGRIETARGMLSPPRCRAWALEEVRGVATSVLPRDPFLPFISTRCRRPAVRDVGLSTGRRRSSRGRPSHHGDFASWPGWATSRAAPTTSSVGSGSLPKRLRSLPGSALC
jgi:hypothetical protein